MTPAESDLTREAREAFEALGGWNGIERRRAERRAPTERGQPIDSARREERQPPTSAERR